VDRKRTAHAATIEGARRQEQLAETMQMEDRDGQMLRYDLQDLRDEQDLENGYNREGNSAAESQPKDIHKR
jgi:hypothetical protein